MTAATFPNSYAAIRTLSTRKIFLRIELTSGLPGKG